MSSIKMSRDEFDIEYGTAEEVTNVSANGFTDNAGEAWETWDMSKPGVAFTARRVSDALTVEVEEA